MVEVTCSDGWIAGQWVRETGREKERGREREIDEWRIESNFISRRDS